MEFNLHRRFKIEDRSYASILKKELKAACDELGIPAAKAAKADIIVSELISNLLKHVARGGEILMRACKKGELKGVEMISVDGGAGMDIPKMMKDDVSTTGTLGQGLGAISRLSDEFDIFSEKSWGTMIVSRVYEKDLDTGYKPGFTDFHVSAVNVPMKQETTCGDGWNFIRKGNKISVIGVDGLGHGPEAQEAARKIIEIHAEDPFLDPVMLIRYIHSKARKTRGAVVMCTVIDLDARKLYACGVGNITGKIASGLLVKNIISHNGIIGYNIPNTMSTGVFDFTQRDTLLLYSDGIRSGLDLGKHPGIMRCDNSILAAAVYKDYTRTTDDTMVLVAGMQKKSKI